MSFKWNDDYISIKQENGYIINLFKNNDIVHGEIDRGETDDFKFKKWRTWNGFGKDEYSKELMREIGLSEALWEYFFGYMGRKSDVKTLLNTPLISDMMATNVRNFLKSLELPFPRHKKYDKLFICQFDRVYINQTPNNDDLALLNISPTSDDPYEYSKKIEELISTTKYKEEKGEDLLIKIPSDKDYPTNGDFIEFYKDCLYKAYKRTDFRILYEPFELTNLFSCPFSGRTPAIENILTTRP